MTIQTKLFIARTVCLATFLMLKLVSPYLFSKQH